MVNIDHSVSLPMTLSDFEGGGAPCTSTVSRRTTKLSTVNARGTSVCIGPIRALYTPPSQGPGTRVAKIFGTHT